MVYRPPTISPAEITEEALFMRRRELLKLGAAGALGVAVAPSVARADPDVKTPPLKDVRKSRYTVDEEANSLEDIASYNNFYEFGTGKEDPARAAHTLRTRPWTVVLDGNLKKPQTLDIDALLKLMPVEERVYRLRCVEAWSMVVPWVGFPLGDLIKRLEPNGNARFVSFTTLHDPEQMPGQRRPILDWPYKEGLRLDEAMHPLTLLAVGVYGRALPNQNGAPLRLVVPWKYGFKSIKSIVRITLTEQQPPTTWSQMAPSEYGFYANVNPDVDHPRWSQARERRIGEFLKRKTLPFNGYAADVASLYQGMDPQKLF